MGFTFLILFQALTMIDEADEAMPGAEAKPRKRHHSQSTLNNMMESPPPSPGRKRKAGPLPRDMPYRKLLTPPPEERPDSPIPKPSTGTTPPSSPRLGQPPTKKHKPTLGGMYFLTFIIFPLLIQKFHQLNDLRLFH